MKHYSAPQSSEATQPVPEKASDAHISAKRKRLFSLLDSETCDDSTSSEDECAKYLSEPCEPGHCNPLEFWKENSKVYSVLASSAPVERIFSTAGLIYKPMRCCLYDKRFEQLMFMKCNGVKV